MTSTGTRVASPLSRDSLPKWRGALVSGPIVLAAVVVLCVHVIPFLFALRSSAPHDPWESAQTIEAWRSARGLPVYETPDRHATLMYGVLTSPFLGAVLTLTGPSNVAGRACALVAALLLVALLVRLSWTVPVTALALLALFVSINSQTSHYFTENRPDMVALCLCAVGLCACFHGIEGTRRTYLVVGSLVIFVAFCFKQTVAPFAAVPLLAVMIGGGAGRSLMARTAALAPLVVLIAGVAVLYFAEPLVFFYMFQVPVKYPISLRNLANGPWMVVRGMPLIFLLTFTCASRPGLISLGDARKLRWLVAALIIALPASAAPAAKDGGAANSWLPLFLVTFTMCGLLLGPVYRELRRLSGASLPRAALGSAILASCLVVTAFEHPMSNVGFLLHTDPRNADYDETVATVATLEGTVQCPEDPTIPLIAKRQVVRSIYLEYDASGWPSTMPEQVVRELDASDFVVDARGWWQDLVRPELLEERGFHLISENPSYGIWARDQAPDRRAPVR